MKYISLREFQLRASKYLKELPIVLTQYNIPIATVNTFVDTSVIKQNLEPIQTKEVEEEEWKSVNRCEIYGCKDFDTNYVEKESYDDESNFKTYGKWLCSYHQKVVK